MPQTLRPGTRIEFTPAGGEPELARIARWTKVSGPVNRIDLSGKPEWHVVQFDDGGKLCMHETAFRVVDNRGA